MVFSQRFPPQPTPCRPSMPLIWILVGFLLAPPMAQGQGSGTPQGPRIKNADLFDKSLKVSAQALASWGAWEDDEALRRIRDIGYRVASHSGFRDYPLSFFLIDTPVPNAMALPGGQIFVTRGMMDQGLTDDMLAALLGHEIGHVALDHHGRMKRKAALMSVLSSALTVGLIYQESQRDRDPYYSDPYNPARATNDSSTRGDQLQAAIASSVVLGELLLRGYSRDHEDESDREGQRWAAAAGFDPRGTEALMDLLGGRLPQSKEYGYLQTHPFFEQRVVAARARGAELKAQPGRDPAAYRESTQKVLLERQEVAKFESPAKELLENAALGSWPRGEAAEQLRREYLATQRSEIETRANTQRNYGALEAIYEAELADVRAVDPATAFLAELETDLAAVRSAKEEVYPEALRVFQDGVYVIGFLETFLSNWPDVPDTPAVALALGDAESRLERPASAVEHFLLAWRKAPESEAGRRAFSGLRVLASRLEDLSALQMLADLEGDEQLSSTAAARLATMTKNFKDLEVGSKFLQAYPASPQAEAVRSRLSDLADQLYSEVTLYQSVGNAGQATERMTQILLHAPMTKAAERLRDEQRDLIEPALTSEPTSAPGPAPEPAEQAEPAEPAESQDPTGLGGPA